MKDKKELIEQIVEIELDMFLTVPTYQKANCQEYPDSFRLHRRAQFSVWSTDTLESYLDDLEKAKEEGLNLMTSKYSRMDDLIPRENTNPLIEKITAIQLKWQREILQKYPNLMSRGRPLSQSDDTFFMTSFETYLKSELETYSDSTLSLLYKDMNNKLEQGVNMSEEVYNYLVKQMGYASVTDAEKVQKQRME